MDFTDERVRVNAVGPGTIDTPGAYGHMKAIGAEALGPDLNDFAKGKKLFGKASSVAPVFVAH